MDKQLHAAMYRSLYLARRVDEEISDGNKAGLIPNPIHLSIGQEAVSVGVCEALDPDDVVFGTYRSHALYVAKGGDIRQMIAELYGKAGGCSKGKSGSMHLADVEKGMLLTSAIVGTGIANAVGYAMALKIQKKPQIVVCFFGDGAMEEGVSHESMNFAALKKLPIIFICENNLYAIRTHLSIRHAVDNIIQRARAYGIPAERIEGNDTLAIYEAVKAARAEVLSGSGPRFFECMTYRWREHLGPGDDFDMGYRSVDEARPWMEGDQVKRVAALLDPSERQAIEQEVEETIRDAFAFAEASPYPDASELYTDVFK